RLEQALKANTQLKNQIRDIKGQFGDASKNNSRLDRELQALTTNNTQLSDELSKIKKISANAIALDHNNRELLQKNELLKIQIEELTAENQRLSNKSNKEWFMYGVFAVFMGALLTVLLPRLKGKRKSSEWA
ncbi:TIGR04211 family SH3 domain-containing protein, partial [bacterium]|nr:TIGR04211 family SH3 domain-containing protein [bacterium]